MTKKTATEPSPEVAEPELINMCRIGQFMTRYARSRWEIGEVKARVRPIKNPKPRYKSATHMLTLGPTETFTGEPKTLFLGSEYMGLIPCY